RCEGGRGGVGAGAPGRPGHQGLFDPHDPDRRRAHRSAPRCPPGHLGSYLRLAAGRDVRGGRLVGARAGAGAPDLRRRCPAGTGRRSGERGALQRRLEDIPGPVRMPEESGRARVGVLRSLTPPGLSPACAHCPSGVMSLVMSRRAPLAILLLGVVLALTPIAPAPPPYPGWILGLY